mgnify:CR=1 FL=1
MGGVIIMWVKILRKIVINSSKHKRRDHDYKLSSLLTFDSDVPNSSDVQQQ